MAAVDLNKDYCIVLKDGKLDTGNGMQPGDIQALFGKISNDNSERLVVHFHGGLVDRQAGITAANALTPIYREAGAYPIFIVWESGWAEVIQQNLPAIFKEDIFQKILMRVTQFAKAKLEKGQGGTPRAIGGLSLAKDAAIQDELDNPAGNEPFPHVDTRVLPAGDELTDEERTQFEDKLKNDPTFQIMAAQIANSVPQDHTTSATSKSITVRGSTKTLMSPEVLRELSTDEAGARGIFSTAMLVVRCGMVLAQVIRRYVQHRDHGFYLTIVEEILRAFYVGNAGRFLWDGMKKDIEDAFGLDAACGGNALIAELEALWKSGKKRQITLVGHSAGAIYVCRLLQEMHKRNLPADMRINVILIAPACSFNLLAKTLRDVGDRVAGLRVFGMGDELERKDAIVPVVYPSSLLYCVSGIVEEEHDCPLAGMARYYVKPYDTEDFSDIRYVRDSILFKKDHALIWSMARTGLGFNCDMESHGGWVNAAATVESVKHIIQTGYDYAAQPN